ncbi:unnamed protein product, partial [Closterium sp. Naga37s-1]
GGGDGEWQRGEAVWRIKVRVGPRRGEAGESRLELGVEAIASTLMLVERAEEMVSGGECLCRGINGPLLASPHPKGQHESASVASHLIHHCRHKDLSCCLATPNTT